MAFFNPLRLLVIPFLTVVTLPLALFAGITTTFAFSVLLFRVMLVYLDLIISFVPTYIFSSLYSRRRIQDTMYAQAGGSHISPISTPGRHRRRRRSSVSLMSADATSPSLEMGPGLIPSVGMDRDFEGIGGWRAGGEDDELWTNINSRLELPEKHHLHSLGRPHHQRALSAGLTTSPKEGGLRLRARTRSPGERQKSASPNSSKIRTPPALTPD
ncbi:hypothetical protein jhhlp_003843 [Lomentospora prolificans]|uniref:Uncharacterized protein n=1 Tax=Lomentospora prolificans TaxID=41688 RepID=A0A2N3N9W1_9PEZI|nr:hypothetical protein jhhlp_003843 [Lomentospora prolificans]